MSEREISAICMLPDSGQVNLLLQINLILNKFMLSSCRMNGRVTAKLLILNINETECHG
jgi:hypothetical protein